MLTDNQRRQLDATIDTLLWKLNRFREMILALEADEGRDPVIFAKTVARADGLHVEIQHLRRFRDIGV